MEIRPRRRGEAQDRDHQGREASGQGANDGARTAEMPGPTSEAGADEESADGDGDGEGDEGGDGGDAEDCANGDRTAEDEERQQDPNHGVEPHGIHRRLRALVDLLPHPRQREHVIAGVGVRDPTRCDHAPLAHAEGAHDGEG